VVTRDVAAGATVAGVPARLVRPARDAGVRDT
jgi:acetyltransferase-like isoleucine patch superfamily enzyme